MNNAKEKNAAGKDPVLRQPGWVWLFGIVLLGGVVFWFQSLGLTSHLGLLKDKAAWDSALEERNRIIHEVESLRVSKNNEEMLKGEAESSRITVQRQLSEVSNAWVAINLQVDEAKKLLAGEIELRSKAELERNQIIDDRDKSVAEVERSRKDVAQLQVQESDLRQKLVALQVSLGDLNAKQQQYTDLTNRVTAFQSKLAAIQHEIGVAGQQLTDARDALSQTELGRNKIALDRDNAAAEEAAVRKSMLSLQSQSSDLRKNIAELQVTLGDLSARQQQYVDITNRLAATQVKLISAYAEVDRTNKEMADISSKIASLADVYRNVQAIVKQKISLEEAVNTLTVSNDYLAASIVSEKKKAESLKKEIETLETTRLEMVRIREELPQKSQELRDLIKNIEGLNTQYAEINGLIKTKVDLFGKVEALKKNEEEWGAKVAALKENVRQFAETLGEMSVARAETSNLVSRISNLRAENAQVLGEISGAKLKLQDLEAQKSQLEGSVKVLQRQVDSFDKAQKPGVDKKGI